MGLRSTSFCAVILWVSACREAPKAPPTPSLQASSPSRRPQPPAAAAEGVPSADRLDRTLPPEHPNQRLAFSRERLAWLDADELRVFELADLTLATSFR